MSKLQGKIALITGGTSGIGLATADLFLAEGAEVYIVGSTEKSLESAQLALRGRAWPIQADMQKLSDIRDMADVVKARHGRLDILFANAGQTLIQPLADIDEATYDRIMDINVKGTFFTIQALAPLMSRGSAALITTSVRNQTGAPGSSVYGASKAAARALARMFAAELVGQGIRVNALCPGAVDTPIYDRAGFTPERIDQVRTRLKSMVPMGRAGTAQEMAKAALFLCSDDASYITGEELVIDGGFATF
jgi:NAD(P)-dependent dehydrogenase (short-subunit alcohol dehydrogenase family)